MSFEPQLVSRKAVFKILTKAASNQPAQLHEHVIVLKFMKYEMEIFY